MKNFTGTAFSAAAALPLISSPSFNISSPPSCLSKISSLCVTCFYRAILYISVFLITLSNHAVCSVTKGRCRRRTCLISFTKSVVVLNSIFKWTITFFDAVRSSCAIFLSTVSLRNLPLTLRNIQRFAYPLSWHHPLSSIINFTSSARFPNRRVWDASVEETSDPDRVLEEHRHRCHK